MKVQHKEKQLFLNLRHLPHVITFVFLGMNSVTHSDPSSPETALHLLHSRYHCGSKEGADSSYTNMSASHPRYVWGPQSVFKPLSTNAGAHMRTHALRAPPLSVDLASVWLDSPIYLCLRPTAGLPFSGGHDHHTNVPARGQYWPGTTNPRWGRGHWTQIPE